MSKSAEAKPKRKRPRREPIPEIVETDLPEAEVTALPRKTRRQRVTRGRG